MDRIIFYTLGAIYKSYTHFAYIIFSYTYPLPWQWVRIVHDDYAYYFKHEFFPTKMNPSITFETKCWERDWKLLLCTNRLSHMIERCSYQFDEKILYINNVKNKLLVCKAADKLINKGVISSYSMVEDFAKEALDFFDIDKESFKGGYYYSIQELVGIYKCKTDFLLHFTGDTILTNSNQWIPDALSKMEENKQYFVANSNWDETGVQAKNQSQTEDNSFYYGNGFSDQCYLIRTSDFKKPIYNETHEASHVYPRYGGELFEKRVDSFMRNHGLIRLTSKHAFHCHKNFPKDAFRRMILYYTGINLKKG